MTMSSTYSAATTTTSTAHLYIIERTIEENVQKPKRGRSRTSRDQLFSVLCVQTIRNNEFYVWNEKVLPTLRFVLGFPIKSVFFVFHHCWNPKRARGPIGVGLVSTTFSFDLRTVFATVGFFFFFLERISTKLLHRARHWFQTVVRKFSAGCLNFYGTSKV